MTDVMKDMRKIESGFETYDDDELHRLEGIQIAKFRGKGAPKKKREANSKHTLEQAEQEVLTVYSIEEEREEEVDCFSVLYTALIDTIPCMKTLHISPATRVLLKCVLSIFYR